MPKKQKRTKLNPRTQLAASRNREAPAKLLSRQRTLVFVCIALAAAAFLHFSVDKFPDPDVFYHYRHAEIYASEGGIFRTSFPWVHYSVISKFSSDLWYGFHLVLIPFTLASDPILGMQLAGMFVTLLFLIACYVVCCCLKIRPAVFWPFFLLFSSAFLLHRLAMLRPQVLSLSLGMLLFALLATESTWGIFIASVASTFLHLNFFFVSLAVLGVFTITKILEEKSVPWRECLALVGGVVAGWLARPNPIGAAQILYVQLFQLTLEKIGGSPLDLAGEMSPLKLKPNSNYLLFISLLLISLLYVFRKYLKKDLALSGRDTTSLITAAALSIIFFLLSVFFARRAFDFCSAFGVILIGLVFSRCLYENSVARIVLTCAFIFLVPYGLKLRDQVLSVGWDPARFKSAAMWIADNSNPGDIVFNARWEYFPELFFWNAINVYVSGMDPILQFAFDPSLYQEGYDMVRDEKPPEGLQDPYRILKEKFNARYLFLAKPFDASLYFRLKRDSRFLLKQENDRSAVFEIS